MTVVAEDIKQEIEHQSQRIDAVRRSVGEVIVGQEALIERLLMALLADGHVLVEGIPGLAKTTAIKALAEAVDTGFARIQFTPDLLPADLIGTQIYRPGVEEFEVKEGPVFTNLLLADEINRAPAKVQSALLEAMQERQVTIGDETRSLPDPFLVLATQNPIEQEGTYPLPEAQVDRFMLKVKVTYPTKDEERQILRRMSTGRLPEIRPTLNVDQIIELRDLVECVYLDPKVEDYIVDLVFATRQPSQVGLDHLNGLIDYGASPRATIFLARTARVQALLSGRAYVTPQDVKSVGLDVLRHRVLLTYEAEAQDLDSDAVLKEIFNTVDVP